MGLNNYEVIVMTESNNETLVYMNAYCRHS